MTNICIKLLNISLCIPLFSGFVQGCKDDVPSLISFQPGFDKGALLSVVYANNKFPLFL